MSSIRWETLSSETVFTNPWIRLRIDQVKQPGLPPRPYSVVELKGGVGVVAINSESQIIIVGQYRYPIGRYSWEIPKGAFSSFDSSQHEPLATATRELKEETGYVAEQWESLAVVHTLLGSTNDEVHLFCARRLVAGKPQPDEMEDISYRWVSTGEFWSMVSNLDITDATSIAAVGLCSQRKFL